MRKDHPLSLAQPWGNRYDPSKSSICQPLYTLWLERTLWSRALDPCSQVIQMVVMVVMVSQGPALAWPRH